MRIKLIFNNRQKLFFVLSIFLLPPRSYSQPPENMTTETINSNSLKTKEFVVMGYEGIIFELNSGTGAYLRTLIDLLNVNPNEEVKTIEKVRALSKNYPNIMDFAAQVVALQMNFTNKSLANEFQTVIPTGPTIYSGDKLENALNHLTRGMKINVFIKSGKQFDGQYVEYTARRLWIKNSAQNTFKFDDIIAIDAPGL